MSLRHRFRARRNRLSRAEYLAKLDLERASAGSFNQDYYVDASQYSYESGAGSYGETVRNNRTVNRSIRRGDFKTTTPYKTIVTNISGSTMVGFLTSTSSPYGTSSRHRLRSYADAVPTWWGGYSSSVPLRQNLFSSAQLASLTKMRKLAPTWDILTSAVELRETLSSIKGAATWTATLIKHVSVRDIPNIIRHLRLKSTPKNRRKIRSFYDVGNGYGVYYRDYDCLTLRVGDVMSNLWMNYRYSFMPTILDIQDAMIALAAPSRASDYELSTQVTLRESQLSDTDLGWIPTFWQYDTLVQYHKRLSLNGSVRIRVRFSFYEDILSRLNPNTLLSFTKTAWETVPFSWMVDWVLGISDYLQLLDLSSIVQKSDVCVMERGTTELSHYLVGYRANYPNSPGYSGDCKVTFAPGQGVSTGSVFFFERSVGSIVVPDWSPEETWYKWRRGLDTAALSWRSVKNSLSEPLDPRRFR